MNLEEYGKVIDAATKGPWKLSGIRNHLFPLCGANNENIFLTRKNGLFMAATDPIVAKAFFNVAKAGYMVDRYCHATGDAQQMLFHDRFNKALKGLTEALEKK